MSEDANTNCVCVYGEGGEKCETLFALRKKKSFSYKVKENLIKNQDFFFFLGNDSEAAQANCHRGAAPLQWIKWHSLGSESDIKPPSIPAPRVTLRMAAEVLDNSFETSAVKQAQCLREKVSEASSNGWGGKDWDPEDLTGAHPAILKEGKKKKECFVRRARGIPWAVSLNKLGVKHPPAPPTPPHTPLHFSSHSLTPAPYPPSPPPLLLPPSLPSSLPPSPPLSLQSDRGIIVPQGFRWCDISVTCRIVLSRGALPSCWVSWGERKREGEGERWRVEMAAGCLLTFVTALMICKLSAAPKFCCHARVQEVARRPHRALGGSGSFWVSLNLIHSHWEHTTALYPFINSENTRYYCRHVMLLNIC